VPLLELFTLQGILEINPGFPDPFRDLVSSPMIFRVSRAAAVTRGVPPKVDAWAPNPKAAATRSRSQHGADGKPVGQGLGQGHDVRCHPIMLMGKKLTRAAHARLDFVQDHQYAPIGRIALSNLS
jgi:hypothetical protein